jgi:hypothetical protein
LVARRGRLQWFSRGNDHTLVIDTTGLDERAWLDEAGHPRSAMAHIQERYTRADQYNLQLTVTVDDPKYYTKPLDVHTREFLLDEGAGLCRDTLHPVRGDPVSRHARQTVRDRDPITLKRVMTMRHPYIGTIAGAATVLVLTLLAAAQNNQQSNAPRSPWKYYPADRAIGDGGPAPKRDLTGTWAGPASGAAVPRSRVNPKNPPAPPLTPLGQQLFARNKPLTQHSPAGTNDAHVRYCDPYGFPQNMTNEIRGMTITTMPNRTFILLQYMDLWREVWTDGRTLPTNVGGRGRDTLDPKYNGYSVGHWEDDYTFVVDTTGLAPNTWATDSGYPHSVDAHVEERFHRDSRNDLTLTITMDDPKLYTKPFYIGDVHFRWIPNQMLDDFNCIPSELQRYLQEMGDPAGSDPSAARR